MPFAKPSRRSDPRTDRSHQAELRQVAEDGKSAKIEDIEPLRAEQDAFIDAVTSGQRPVVSGEDGMAAVELAGTRIVKAMGSTTI